MGLDASVSLRTVTPVIEFGRKCSHRAASVPIDTSPLKRAVICVMRSTTVSAVAGVCTCADTSDT